MLIDRHGERVESKVGYRVSVKACGAQVQWFPPVEMTYITRTSCIDFFEEGQDGERRGCAYTKVIAYDSDDQCVHKPYADTIPLTQRGGSHFDVEYLCRVRYNNSVIFPDGCRGPSFRPCYRILRKQETYTLGVSQALAAALWVRNSLKSLALRPVTVPTV